jgi:hypothetical protein
MSSSSSSPYSSPEPSHTALKGKAKAKKSKKKATSAAGLGRNEGVDPTWAYKPPPDFALLDTSSNELGNAGVFDWDAVADNPDLELWLIRVPEAVRTSSPSSPFIEINPGAHDR